MKYYKGTRKRKRSSKSTFTSPESQNTSNNAERSEVPRDENKSHLSARERKRPSSASPQTEKQSARTRTKKPKPNHATPTEEPNYNNRKTSSEKLPDLPDKNEINMTRKRSRGGIATRSSTRDSRSDESSRKRTKTSEHSNSTSSVVDEVREIPENSGKTLRKKLIARSSNAGSSRSNGPSRKGSRKGSSEAITSSSAASKVKTKPSRIPRVNVQKSARKTKTKSKEPSSSVSSETEESVFEDSDSHEEMQDTIQREESESHFETSCNDTSYNREISCSEFLQKQVKILRSEFEIEDCPELAKLLQGNKREQKNHIPKEIVLKVLRRLNVKVEDELLRSLNRQAQRKILKQVDEIRSNYSMLEKKTSNEENTGQQPEGKVEELREKVEMSVAELNGLKRLTDMSAQIESMAKGFSTNPLKDEVKHTNKLIQKLNQKVQKEGFTNADEETLTKGPLSHQEIVNKLFS